MKKRILAAAAFLLACFLLFAPMQNRGLLYAYADAVGYRVYVISVEDAVEAGLSSYMRRAFGIIDADPLAKLVLVEVDTPGGTIAAAQKIRKTIESCPVETVALVTGGAISAGTYIAMSCDTIAMQPGTTIGDVEPRLAGVGMVDEKFMSYWRAEMSSLAEARGRNKEIALAMVDREVVIEGLKEAGKLLTLTAREAFEVGFADYLVANREELKAVYGLDGAQEEKIHPSATENLARFVTNPAIAPLILILGVAGIVIEFLTPGFGIAGVLGGLCLILFFAGHLIAGFTGWGIILLFLVGVLFLLVEAFIPGFGVPGLIGIMCLSASIVLVAPSFQVGIQSLVVAIIGSAVLIALAAAFIGKSSHWNRISLQLSFGKEAGYISQEEDYSGYVGKRGVTATALRPAGFVMLDDGKRIDVVAQAGFIEKDKRVAVIKTDGPRIVVAPETADT